MSEILGLAMKKREEACTIHNIKLAGIYKDLDAVMKVGGTIGRDRTCIQHMPCDNTLP